MAVVNGFRLKRKVEEKCMPEESIDIDFDAAITTFKEMYMVDDWSPRTLDFHLEVLSSFIKFLKVHVGDTDVITTVLLEEYIKDMRHRGLKKNTINGRIKSLRVFFRLLHTIKYISFDPAINLKTIKGPKPVIIPFSDEQVDALLRQPDRTSFIGVRDYAFMQIMLDTGIRLAELCNLARADVDVKKRCINVKLGKNRKSRTSTLVRKHAGQSKNIWSILGFQIITMVISY